ncbi:MAG TPA: transaldolase family protein [Gemmataceae bacterium]|jgi:transaldolase
MAKMTPLQSLVATGTKLWLDSVDPDEVKANRAFGATGATSNPIIISDLIKTGRFDHLLMDLIRMGNDDDSLAWGLTDHLVQEAQRVFLPVWEETKGDDGYVSFELDPLLEDRSCRLSLEERKARYVELGKKWSKGHKNRMIKVPATPAGLGALEALAAAGVTLNVTLIFGEDQYHAAREAIWRGAQRRPGGLTQFKSVYSIFVSRLDVYTEKQVPSLSPASQGQVGIVNAKRIWKLNNEFWANKKLPLKQEMIFASTGVKKKGDPAWKYVEAFAGDGIETNPPATNHAVQESGRTFTRQVDKLPPPEVLKEIDEKVNMKHLEETLMEEGLKKFADPQHALLHLISEKRASLTAGAAR